MTSDLDEIWRGDLLKRRGDAELLAAYVGSVTEHFAPREDMRALTIALDAPYGVGKTFFLKRFAKHIGATHPVAFVDAWADDIADEPLTALAATLKEALEPVSETEVASALDRVLSASGKIVKIASLGAAKRLAGLAITAGAAELIEQTVRGVAQETKDDVAAAIGESSKDALDGAGGVIANTAPNRLMLDRIASFQEGKEAIQSVRKSLEALVSALVKSDLRGPIVIVIDELDRCRPTYAVKLLEEIKHLFDVEGLVFILGMNFDQLSRSVRGMYGSDFDGQSYLSKFIGRKYRLSEPELTELFTQLLRGFPEMETKVVFPSVRIRGRSQVLSLAELLARYCRAYGIQTRDAFLVYDRLVTCARVTGNATLVGPYLVPLVIAEIKNAPRGTLLDAIDPDLVGYEHGWWDGNSHRIHEISLQKILTEMHAAASMPRDELWQRARRERTSLADEVIAQAVDYAERAKIPLASPSQYGELLNTVARFEPTTVG